MVEVLTKNEGANKLVSMSLSHSGTSLFISVAMGTNLTTGTQKPHKCYCIVILESINSSHRAFGPVGIRTNESSLLRLSPQLSNGARQSYIHLLWVLLCLHVHTDTHREREREREMPDGAHIYFFMRPARIARIDATRGAVLLCL